MFFKNMWLLQEQKPLIHNITARGTYHLDGYDVKAVIQNLYDKNEWDFYCLFHTVALWVPWGSPQHACVIRN